MMAKLDRKGKRLAWTQARKAERQYNSHLRAVAVQVGVILKGLAPNGAITNLATLLKALKDYATTIEPWAEAVAALMLKDVARRDATMWRRQSAVIGRELRREIETAPTGLALRQLQESQVKLIKSLPLSAAERVHELATDATITSKRASEVAKEILKTEAVTEARARLIARTEVARASSNLLQARAMHAGSEGYIWRTSGDSDVRDSHKDMEGKYVRWSEPPTLDKLTGHAGTLPNCRCFAEPIFPDN